MDVARTTSPGTGSINGVCIVSLLLNDRWCSHWHTGAGSASLEGEERRGDVTAASCGGERRRHFTWAAVGRRNGDGLSKGLETTCNEPS